MASTHYAFAEKASKLVQIVVNRDGLVQLKVRKAAAGVWPGPSVPPEPFAAPADPSIPVTFTVAVDPGSWGLFAIQMSEWENYSALPMFVLGAVDGTGEVFEDGDVEYGTGVRNPLGKMPTSMTFTIEKNLIRYASEPTPGVFQAQIDTLEWFSQSPANRRVCFVFRLTEKNFGSVKFTNLRGTADVAL